jgi:hypothetical protein
LLLGVAGLQDDMLALHIAELAKSLAEEFMDQLGGGRRDRGEYAERAFGDSYVPQVTSL